MATSCQNRCKINLSILILSVIIGCLGQIAQSVAIDHQLTPKFAQVKVVTRHVSQLGDAPYWDAENNFLYYVDGLRGEVCRLNVVTDEEVRISLRDDVSHISPLENEPGHFLVTRLGELIKLNWDTQGIEIIATITKKSSTPTKGVRRPEQFNDAKRDPWGRLFVGSVTLDFFGVATSKGGNLYRYDEGKDQVTSIRRGFTISNGMAWSNDVNHTKFYFVDTGEKKIFVFDYDIEIGWPSNERVLWQTSDPIESPDGIIMDDEGFLWVCMYAGGRLIKLDAQTGVIVDTVSLETAHVPTSLARGCYQGQDGYYVTTAENYLVPRPDDGKVLHISFPDEGNTTNPCATV